jgi:hypothetical protein
MTDEDFDDQDDLLEVPRGPSISPEDYEVLSLAAMAIGCEDVEAVEGEQWVNLHFPDGTIRHGWNPKRHSDDALDLAIRLKFHLITHSQANTAYASTANRSVWWDVEHGTDPAAALRLAITHAAAEMGKQHSS